MKRLVYGYARISTMKQKIQRQIDNIKERFPDAVIIEETFTGTTTDRPQWNNLIDQVKKQSAKGAEITLVFDEVSRMSRNAEEGFSLYRELYEMGINLVFLKEPHINTDVFKSTAQTPPTGVKDLDETLIKGLNEYLMRLAEKQIRIAFDTAQAEIDYLHQRTSEGVRKAQAAGKQVGRKAGTKAGKDFKDTLKVTKKAIACKKLIRKYSKDFDGDLSDVECIRLINIARNSYYKYKAQLREEV